MSNKPPLGIKPRRIWLTDRALGLTSAISDYIRSCSEIGVSDEQVGDRMSRVFSWSCELRDVLEEIGHKPPEVIVPFQRGGVVAPKLKTGGGFGQWADGGPAVPYASPGGRS